MSRRSRRRNAQQRQVQDSMAPSPAMTLTPVTKAHYDAAVEFGTPQAVTDAFSNPAARTGYGTANLLQFTQFPHTNLTQAYHLLTSLYRSNWIVKNIIDAFPEDMLKAWIRLQSQVDPKAIDRFASTVRRTRIRSALADGLRWGRLYGGAGGLILIDGQQHQLEEPLDYTAILPDSFKGLHIIDRWSGIFPEHELVTDIGDPDFRLPAYYQVHDDSGHQVVRVHHSRILRFTGAKLPYIDEIGEQYWGASELEAVYADVVRRENVAENIASLTFQANIAVMEYDGLDQLFGVGNAQAQTRFWNMMQQQTLLRSNLGLQLINKGNKYETHSYTFAGLADVYEAIQMDVAGATGIPVTRLFGRSPGGLNATGESDMENYYGRVEQKQDDSLRPLLDRLLPVVAMSAWGELPDDFDFGFNPVRTPKTDEMAKIVDAKSEAIIKSFKEGLLDQGTAQKELRELADSTGLFSNVTDAMIKAGLDKWVWQLGGTADVLAGLRLPRPHPTADDDDLLTV